jgi:hypothetical protein
MGNEARGGAFFFSTKPKFKKEKQRKLKKQKSKNGKLKCMCEKRRA